MGAAALRATAIFATSNVNDSFRAQKASATIGDVSVSSDMGPVFLQNLIAVIIDLDLPLHFKPDTLSREIESADPGKQRSDRERHGVGSWGVGTSLTLP
jgi:hypothetical protein